MSAYLSRGGLVHLRERLSERDLAVVRSVKNHRFLTSAQIEEFHFSNHSTPDAGARVCRRVLARLTRDRLVRRLQRRMGGIRAGSASWIYAVGPIGRRLLGDDRRGFSEPSPLFLDHTLAVAETHVDLVRAARARRLELVQVEVEPSCWRRYIGPGGAPEIVRPDLYVITAAGSYEDCWMLEVDRSTESPAALTRKLRIYEQYWRSGREQQTHGIFPLVVWIAPDETREKRLESIVGSVRNLKHELFRTTTSERLIEFLAGSPA
jgi:Replication-relaxation